MMKLKFTLVLFLVVSASYNCLSQTNLDNSKRLYKVVNIDSTDHNYYVVISKIADTIASNRATLIKNSDCNNYLSFNNPKSNFSCVISEKTNNSKRNIFVGDTINLTLKQIFGSSKIFPSSHAFAHVGFGDYIDDTQSYMFYSSDEVFGLHCEKDSMMLQRFYAQRNQLSYFDSQMLKIWMKLSNSKTCYLKWLNNTIEDSKVIEISDVKNSFILYKDSDYLFPFEIKDVENIAQNDVIKARLFYQNKHQSFIQINDSSNPFYGWVKLKQNKNSNHYFLQQQ